MKWTVLLTIFSLILIPALYAGSEVIFIGSITVNQGSEARVVITLDSAPNGLSGYDITVYLRNGEVADIIGIEFPEWAKLSDKSIRDDSAGLKAVDLENRIKPGDTNIWLATIIFGNTKPGESLIELTVKRMDDDNGNPINPSIKQGKLTVVVPTYTQTTTAATTDTQKVTEKTTTFTKTFTLTETTQVTISYISTVYVQTDSTIYLIITIIMTGLLFATIAVILTKSHMSRGGKLY